MLLFHFPFKCISNEGQGTIASDIAGSSEAILQGEYCEQ